jgi:hypothetical protein
MEKSYPAQAGIKSKHRNRFQLEGDLRVAASTVQVRQSYVFPSMPARLPHWVSTFSRFYILSVSIVNIEEDGMISLGGHEENRGSNLMRDRY